MADLEIRQPILAEATVVGDVGYASWLKGIWPLIPAEARARVSRADFIDMVVTHAAHVLIALEAGAVAGIVATEDGDNFITDLWVSPVHEGRGVGTALLHAMEGRLKALGYSEAKISALTGNERALRLYRYVGYEDMGIEHLFDSALGIDIERVRLRKTL